MLVCYTVKYEVGNHGLGWSDVKSPENVGDFTVLGEWYLCWWHCCCLSSL